MASREEMSLSFGAAAGAYEAGRPDYPREAVDWLLAPVREQGRALRVADVGAGTGKLTRTVVEAGAEVVAIDPDPGMLAVLREHVRGVPTFAGTAERMPLPDHSLDAVLLGQAWHWVDPVPASADASSCGLSPRRRAGVPGAGASATSPSAAASEETTRTFAGRRSLLIAQQLLNFHPIIGRANLGRAAHRRSHAIP